jgi:hypothetical protein
MKDKNMGRNAACPCGSGRKFKLCHGLGASGRLMRLPVLVAVVLVVSALFLFALIQYGSSGHQAPASKTTHYPAVPGLEAAGLTEEEKTRLIAHYNHTACPCECNMRVAECRNIDPTCIHSKQVVDADLASLAAKSPTLSMPAPVPAH